MSARDKIGEDRFFDVSYHDVMANPARTVERIYERFGLKKSEEHVAAIRDWLEKIRRPNTARTSTPARSLA